MKRVEQAIAHIAENINGKAVKSTSSVLAEMLSHAKICNGSFE